MCVVVPDPEKALIRRIRRRVDASAKQDRRSRAILTGIGDDCAVLRPPSGCDLLTTTDFTLEGIHFRRNWHPPESVGYRCLARGLSDIAAMGGEPVAVFLSLALPRDLPQSWVNRFSVSLIGLSKEHGAVMAGGDTAQSPDGILADIIVIGSVPRGKAILRSRAKPGDRIYISGELGGSAAAVLQMQKQPRKETNRHDFARHFYPTPRVELGRTLREKNLASAMIDTSDGLSTDLAHLCEESGVGAEIEASLIPRASVGRPVREVDLSLALHGGEDYELLFTARPERRVPKRIAGVAITQIGVITRSRKIFVQSPESVGYELHAQGWEHFRK